MEEYNRVIEVLTYNNNPTNQKVEIKNCIIALIDFDSIDFQVPVIIENCIIKTFLVHSCWFRKGLVLKNSRVIDFIDYQMGGHNEQPIVISNNYFGGFVNFFDCQFLNKVTFTENVFFKGTNLLGNKNEGFVNTFEQAPFIENNVGFLDLDEIEAENNVSHEIFTTAFELSSILISQFHSIYSNHKDFSQISYDQKPDGQIIFKNGLGNVLIDASNSTENTSLYQADFQLNVPQGLIYVSVSKMKRAFTNAEQLANATFNFLTKGSVN
jgi:hypothetical protein